ncbi:MAG: glycoside hydrolase [Bryobacteraceae bacterium]|nr:glycoside hydrolase [Bryobacteraceae bacterium]
MIRLVCALVFAQLVASAQQKKIYIALDDHTDYVWTADEETYRQAFLEMIDYYLDLADKTKNEPPEWQSRFHVGGNFWVKVYEQNKSPKEFERLMAAIRSGHLSMPLNALDQTYGATPTEAVLRGMYYAGSLERKHNIRIPLATAMENQTLPYGLGSLFAGAGAKYSWRGICGCLTKINKTGKRPHEIYWWKGADGSKLLMKWHTLINGESGSRTIGGYAEARVPDREIEFVMKDQRFVSRYPYPEVGIFGKGWDDLKTMTDEFVVAARKNSNSERKVIVSNMVDFFEEFESKHGAKLPEFNASFGNEWDLYSASVTEVASRVRRGVEKLRGAEALVAYVSQKFPEFMTSRHESATRAWVDLGLFWEHNWTADARDITREYRNQWGRRVASDFETYVNSLQADAVHTLGGMIASEPSAQRRFYVFNPLGWQRSDAADVALDSIGPVHVVDLSTGEEVPSQIVQVPGEQDLRLSTFLRIAARDLPPVGYKVYEVRNGAGQKFADAATVADGSTAVKNGAMRGKTIENAAYKLLVEDRGAISSWVDKERGNRELSGKLENGRSTMNDLGLDPGQLEVENAGPVSVTLRARGDSPLMHESRITLYRDGRRVDIRNDITENFGGTHHWAFSFNVASPDIWHEEIGAVIRAKLQQDGGHYSAEMSRLDYLSLNHFAAMSAPDGSGVTLSNWDLAFMKLGDSQMLGAQSFLDTKTASIQVLAGGQIDAPRAGVAKQGGDKHFLQRFALSSHAKFRAADSMRFSLEHQNPPITGWVRNGKAFPAKTDSLLSVNNPNLLLWSLKVAEDGPAKGLVTRFWNLSGQAEDYQVKLKSPIRSAWKATHTERDLSALPVVAGSVAVNAAAQQIQTLRIEPRP